MKKYIPLLLIISRFLMGCCILLLSIFHSAYFVALSVTMLIAGVITDIADGIIARQLNISTQQLRRLDSATDQVFFIAVAVAAYIHCPDFFAAHQTALIILLSSEAATYIISWIKFKKEIATHTIGAKIWTLILVALLTQLFIQCNSGWLFYLCCVTGVITRIEIIAIVLTLKQWTNDVPTWYHALLLRKGKTIRRNKLMNG